MTDEKPALRVANTVASAMLRNKIDGKPFQKRFVIDRDDAFALSRSLHELGLTIDMEYSR